MAETVTAQNTDVGGKHLTLMLADEMYGIEILKVREIIGMIDITPIPQTPSFVKGVINLRGKLIAVIDLRTKFGLQEKEYSSETCMIIVDIANKQIGLIVDSVREVIDIVGENISKTPSFGSNVNVQFIKGLGKVGKDVIIILDIDRVLNDQEMVAVSSF